MPTPAKRATVYFDPALHKARRLKAAETERSVSDLVNEAARALLAEDTDDLAALPDRADEPTVWFESSVARQTASGSWTGSRRWPTTRHRLGAPSCRAVRLTGFEDVYRIVYTVAADVLVVEVGNRREVYRWRERQPAIMALSSALGP